MSRKNYSGYRSFEYLEAGVDYKAFDLARELDRVPSRRVAVSEAQARRVEHLLADNVVISLHDQRL